MSEEVHNSRVIKIASSLPGSGCDDDVGYIGIMTDGSRGSTLWVPDGDETRKPGKTVRHQDWQTGLAALQNPARDIHDFYFEPHIPAETCACCAGSGKNKDFQELFKGFYRSGGGRWAGWGDRILMDDELDYLHDRGRFGVTPRRKITGLNYRRYFETFFGTDAVDQWRLTPIRAKHLGISTNDCEECVGKGLSPSAPARISLNVWTFDPAKGTSRVDVIEDVRMDELEEVREYLSQIGWDGVMRRLGWAVGDNLHSAIPYERHRTTYPLRRFKRRSLASFGDDIAFKTFSQFADRFDLCDPALASDTTRFDSLNLVFDCWIHAPDGYEEENPFASSELPENFSLSVWMSHPRKGADRLIFIEDCSRKDGELIRSMLARSFAVHGRHFSWAVGREFGNEDRPEEVEEDEFTNSTMRIFAGI